MASDRTIDQAANITTLLGVVGHVAVLPDGHEGYGFPVGGVAAIDLNLTQEEGVISIFHITNSDTYSTKSRMIQLKYIMSRVLRVNTIYYHLLVYKNIIHCNILYHQL